MIYLLNIFCILYYILYICIQSRVYHKTSLSNTYYGMWQKMQVINAFLFYCIFNSIIILLREYFLSVVLTND